ncbi:MAG TPA: hypothetical protein V6C52_12590 [Coleofasciculaceae cyanobacterium]|jgi:hypothetical protein
MTDAPESKPAAAKPARKTTKAKTGEIKTDKPEKAKAASTESVKENPAQAEQEATAETTPEKPAKAATATAVADKPTVEEKPAAPAATSEKPEPPAAPAEPPFTVDDLLSCTARYTHKAWHLFYSNRKDMDFIRKTPVRATLEARTAAGAEELQKLLVEAGVQEISRNNKVLSFTATFEAIQTVIRLPQTYRLDAIRL